MKRTILQCDICGKFRDDETTMWWKLALHPSGAYYVETTKDIGGNLDICSIPCLDEKEKSLREEMIKNFKATIQAVAI